MTHFEHQVRERAYYIWEEEGRVFGKAEDHWLRAETEFRALSRAEPVRVQAIAPTLTLSPSPAEVLKAKPGRSRLVAAKVDAKVKTAAAETVETASKPARKGATAKPTAVTKAASKGSPVKAAKVSKTAGSTVSAAKAIGSKTTARPRATESNAMVH